MMDVSHDHDHNLRMHPCYPGFWYEIPTRLAVGQDVTAYHKSSKLLARGQILTVDYEEAIYRVQFERFELGTELCSVGPG